MPRIVSLIASATEIVDSLGLLPHLVGRSHECDYPPAVLSLPVCTRPRLDVEAPSDEIDRLVRQARRNSVSIYDVYEQVIDSLAPTHILTQIQCEVCAVSLRDVELAIGRGMKGTPDVVSLQPDSLPGIFGDVHRVAQALGEPSRGTAVVAELERRCAALAETAHRAAPVRTACIEWMEPLMPAAWWMPKLIEMANGINAEWHTWEELRDADPDVIVVAPCGFPLPRVEREMHFMTARPGWRELRAVREGRVYLADGNLYFNRPSPRVVETLEILVEILHPELGSVRFFPAGWRQFPLEL